MRAAVSRPRGFTLVELILAIVLASLVGGVVHRLLFQGQRLARAQAERTALHENVRVAALVLAGELAGAGYDEVTPAASAALGYPVAFRSDLLAIAPGAVTYLADRGGGYVCRVSTGPAVEIVVAEPSWASPRAPRATDSLLVFVEGDPTTGSDDAWLHLGIVSAGTAVCASGGAGIALRVAAPAPLDPAVLAGVTSGSPVRLAEVMQMRYYRSGGKSWLGMRSVGTSETIQPIAGPLADSSLSVRGLTLVYRDAADAPTSDPAAVRAIEIALVGVTDQPIHARDPRHAMVDTFALATRLALRNAPLP
jgi:prepilin-type N-terminal cleavage/methylation domain-containing protein